MKNRASVVRRVMAKGAVAHGKFAILIVNRSAVPWRESILQSQVVNRKGASPKHDKYHILAGAVDSVAIAVDHDFREDCGQLGIKCNISDQLDGIVPRSPPGSQPVAVSVLAAVMAIGPNVHAVPLSRTLCDTRDQSCLSRLLCQLQSQ